MEKIIIASGPVIVEDGKVLLDKHGDDEFWKFCGGKTQENENLKETAKHRAKEELGIDIEISDEEPFIMQITKTTDQGPVDVLLVHFLAKRRGDITPGNEVKEWQWLPINALPEDVAPNIIPTLKHFKFL